jgi:hypothetical protein
MNKIAGSAGVSRDACASLPGNHDIDRKAAKKPLVAGDAHEAVRARRVGSWTICSPFEACRCCRM